MTSESNYEIINHYKCISNDPEKRLEGLMQLELCFSEFSDQLQAWYDLRNLIKDDYINIKYEAIRALGSVFSHIIKKEEAWDILHKLTYDADVTVRERAVEAIGSAFPHIPDKLQAEDDLHRLTKDKELIVRLCVAMVIGSVFSFETDKQQASNDLQRLIYDEVSWVSYWALISLGSAFPYIVDKQQAFNDLHRLTNNQKKFVREGVASALGSAFTHIPDKEQAMDDLKRLTNDLEGRVRIYANHSLGKVSILKASQAEIEEEYRKELENAIEFFEKSVLEHELPKKENPAHFCLPFYKSLYVVIFKKQEAKGEVSKYLAEAKDAVQNSKSRELLFEAIENLTNALKEVQELERLDFQTMKDKLSSYRIYCNHAERLMKESEKITPFAVETIRKGLPILDKAIKDLIKEIQEKAKVACNESKGTAVEEIACDVSRETHGWEIGTPEEMSLYIGNFISALESKIPRFSENEHIFEMINKSKDQKDLKKLLENTSELMDIIPKITIDPDRMKPTIGIVTALPEEYAAVTILMEVLEEDYYIPGKGAGRRYCLGAIQSKKGSNHNLVLTMVDKGNIIASSRASILLEHFTNVELIIRVGIAGGVPNPKKVDEHVRLGDIVVSNEKGVIQYDFIKQEIKENTLRNLPRPPDPKLLEAVSYLEAKKIRRYHPWEDYITEALSILRITRPPTKNDILYCTDDQDQTFDHPEDPKRTEGQPRIFIGPIASANILQKDPTVRDKLRDKFEVKAIEMEASGIADATWNHGVGYLVVRGISDYCDSHKNDAWKLYAAVVAAAYTRALIESMP